MKKQNTDLGAQGLGYLLGVFGVVLVLLWIGVYKFTPTEAKLIEPLVVNHPLMSWLYNLFSVQMVSNFIGATEIIVAIGLVIGLKKPQIGYCLALQLALFSLQH
ncbi:hypothetical protein VV1062A_04541 [Vibrio vulnificus]|nr:hypothetical protein VV1062A_04541 [Vibrio vulnificus]